MDPHFSRVSHLLARLVFICEILFLLKIEVVTYFILFYYKRENKTRKKNPKK